MTNKEKCLKDIKEAAISYKHDLIEFDTLMRIINEPVPPETKYRPWKPNDRPWKPNEIPFGALLKWKIEKRMTMVGRIGFDYAMIIGFNGTRIITGIPNCNYTLETCMKCFNVSTDGGKTWSPAGILID